MMSLFVIEVDTTNACEELLELDELEPDEAAVIFDALATAAFCLIYFTLLTFIAFDFVLTIGVFMAFAFGLPQAFPTSGNREPFLEGMIISFVTSFL